MLKHLFITKCHNLVELFEVTTLKDFMKILEQQAKLDPLRYDTLKYLGDGFELFIEVFIELLGCDNRIGLIDYEPNQGQDNGVDGTAFNINLEKSVIQIKYRSNNQTLLSSNKDHLANLFSDGMLNFDVVADKKSFKHFIFTTAKGLHFYTDSEMFKGKVKCFGYNEISSLVDNNLPYWTKAKQLLNEKIKK